jgi:hypothetical protein
MSIYDEILADIIADGITAPGRYLIRNSSDDLDCSTKCAVSSGDHLAHLLVPCSVVNQPKLSNWPTLRGFQISSRIINSVSYVVISAQNAHGTDLGKVSEDILLLVAHKAPRAASERKTAESVIASIIELQELFASDRRPLSAEARVGLFAEMEVLRTWLIPRLGAEAAINAWTGPKAAPQDFQADSCAIEVKATRSSAPQHIRISSERQLETRNLNRLFLVRFSVDEKPAQGVSLPRAVDDIRSLLESHPLVLLEFNILLLRVGYLDDHAPQYLGELYAIRERYVYEVREGFPRIIESQLPVGLGKVSYDVDSGACEPFAVLESVVTECLSGR